MQSSVFVRGAVAGCAATAPMTLTMKSLGRFLPPQEEFELPPHEVTAHTASRSGVRQRPAEETQTTLTYLAHFGFGAAAGAIYAPLADRLPVAPVLSGAMFGLAVWTASYAGVLPTMAIMPPPAQQTRSRNAQLVLSHIVWGVSLGLLVDRLES